MLILSRKPNEAITIGDDVVITVLDIRPNSVRIGITAPKDTPVHRYEIAEAIAIETYRRQKEQS